MSRNVFLMIRNLDMMVLMLFFFACMGSSSSPDPVDTSAYIVLWNDEPNRFVEEVGILPLEEKMIIVRSILEEPSSHHTPQLCRLFEGQEKEYCNQLLYRSHIWEFEQIKQNRKNERHPVGLRSQKSMEMKTIEANYSQKCRLDNSWCIEEEAKQNITDENILFSKGLCQSIPKEQAREECFFQIAEELIKKSPPSQTPEVMRLCAYSNSYQESCYAHVIEKMAENSSELFPDYKREISNFWATKDIKFEKQLLDYLETSFARRSPLSNEISFIHRHSALTFSFLQKENKQDLYLEEWIEMFRKNHIASVISSDIKIRDYWSPLRDRGQAHCLYLSLSYRPCSKDEEKDLELAMVAALLQQDFPVTKIRELQDDTLRKMLNKVNKPH